MMSVVLFATAVISALVAGQDEDAVLGGSLIRYNGEVNIGILVNLHHPNSASNSVDGDDSSDHCGPVNVDAMQQVLAARWAVDVINNQSLPHELNIGLQVHDTCGSGDLTQNHLLHIITSTRNDEDGDDGGFSRASTESPPLLGMIGVGDSVVLSQTSGALRAFGVPLISASPEHAESLTDDEDDGRVLTTAPDLSSQARAVASLLFEMEARSVSLISSSHRAIQTFLAEATTMGIRVPRILELGQVEDQPNQVEDFLRHMMMPDHNDGGGNVVVLLAGPREAGAVAEHLRHVRLPGPDPTWLVGSLGLDLSRMSAWRGVFHGGVFVQPHTPELREFKKYFVQTLRQNKRQNPSSFDALVDEYKEEMFGCANDHAASSFLMPCNEIPEAEIDVRFRQDPQVSFVVKAVSALTAAFRLAQLERCSDQISSSCLRHVRGDDELHDSILGNLRKLSFSPPMMKEVGRGNKEVEGTQHHFTRNGRLVANKQQVYAIDRFNGLKQVGWYSEDEGLNLDNSIENALPTTAQPFFSPLVNEEVRSGSFARSVRNEKNYNPFLDRSSGEKKAIKMMKELPIFSYESFISRTWALVVVSAAIFGFLAALWMLVYVFQKMCDGTLAGNQIMGVVLLIGVMMLFASVVPWLLPPNELICALRHFLHPLLLVLCFAILLVKSMQLRSLITIGLGGTIPQVNQVLSLIFMVMVQVVIAAEWYLATSPIGVHIIAGYPECSVSPSRFLLLHIYPTVLLLLTFFYGVSVLKVKRNFNEGRWITCAAVFILPIFAAWPVVYYFAPVPFHDPSVAVSVVAVAGVLLACVFLPKMHTISLQSRIKQASADLSRTHSDATVYTGFSDYAAMSAGSNKPLYPIYGYTTNQFVPQFPTPIALSSSSKSNSYNKNKSSKNKASVGTGNFRNINYVPAHHANGPQVRSYTDWSREYEPAMNSQHHRIHKRIEHDSSHKNYHQDQTVYSVSSQTRPHNSRKSNKSRQYHQRYHHEDGELLGLPPPPQKISTPPKHHSQQRRRSHSDLDEYENEIDHSMSQQEEEDVTRLTEEEEVTTDLEEEICSSSHKKSLRSAEAAVDEEDEDVVGVGGYFDKGALHRFRHRRRHSRSPSDGMILTASGLTTNQQPENSPGYTVSEVFLTH